MKKRVIAAMLILSMCLALVACGKQGDGEQTSTEDDKKVECPNEGDPIRFASFGDTAGTAFGQLIMQALIANGYEVEDHGGMDVYAFRDALKADEIDMVMDYEGDAPSYMDLDDLTPFQKYMEGWKLVADWDLKENGLVWFEPSIANNVGVIVCRKDFAEENNLKNFGDFAEYVKNGGETLLVGPSFWIDGDYKFLLMEAAYDFKVDRETQVIYAEGTNEKMCAEGVDGVNFAVAWAHAGSLNALDMCYLVDEEETTMRYSYCPVIRQDVLELYPEIRDIVEPIIKEVTDDDARWLGEQIEVEGRSGEEVAIEYLTEHGWLD